MKYTFERVHDIFGTFWVIYENTDGLIQRTVFYSHSYEEAMGVLKELRGE